MYRLMFQVTVSGDRAAVSGYYTLVPKCVFCYFILYHIYKMGLVM